MVNIVLGILFIAFSLTVSFFSPEQKTDFYVNVIPDFIGYLLLWFAVEKVAVRNRSFKLCSTFSAALLAISFLQFLAQISFLLPFGVGDSNVFHTIFGYVNDAFGAISGIYAAITMFFLCLLSFAFSTEMKNYLATGFKFISILFVLLAVFCIVSQFVEMPIETWMFTTPVAVIFTAAAGYSCRNIEELK